MHRGYIKDWRKSLDNPLFKKPLIWHFWGYCLKKTSHKDRDIFMNGQMISIKRGQFVFGRKIASEETGLSEQQIRTCLKHLEKSKNLTSTSTNKYSIITIINWDTYQQDDEISTSTSTNNQPAINQQSTTDKNVKHLKHVNNKEIPEGILLTEEPVNVNICPHKKIRELYNSILGSILPKCKSTNKTFESYLKSRWREDPERQNLKWWSEYFNFVSESDFLMGRSDGNFLASFEWIIKPTNMSKILNGNYKNKKEKSWTLS